MKDCDVFFNKHIHSELNFSIISSEASDFIDQSSFLISKLNFQFNAFIKSISYFLLSIIIITSGIRAPIFVA
jgi:hypothetical protein